MIAILLSGPYAPFTLSLALLFGLLALEIVLLMVGGSLMGESADADAPGMGPDGPGIDIAPDLGAQIDAIGSDVDLSEFDLTPDVGPSSAAAPAQTGPLTWLGLGAMPMLIWLATVFLAFGTTGLALQTAATALLGAPLPAALAALPCAVAALWVVRRFGSLFARLIPRTETQSVSKRQLGRRIGTVTQGTAARGRPAEVRVTDRHGNTHHLRAEPLSDTDTIPQGAEVLVLLHRPTGGFRLIAL